MSPDHTKAFEGDGGFGARVLMQVEHCEVEMQVFVYMSHSKGNRVTWKKW
jgi:hypothetical protein